jgi:septal ring factor EnvC (AmiA/AmiB activator)
MTRTLPFAAVVLLACGAARAQDVQGIELCTHETRMDRRTSCLQSNVEYLHGLIAKNAADAQQKLNAAAGEIAALKSEIGTLKATLATLQASVEKLQADAKKREAPASKADKQPSKPDAK